MPIMTTPRRTSSACTRVAAPAPDEGGSATVFRSACSGNVVVSARCIPATYHASGRMAADCGEWAPRSRSCSHEDDMALAQLAIPIPPLTYGNPPIPAVITCHIAVWFWAAQEAQARGLTGAKAPGATLARIVAMPGGPQN